MIFILLLLFFLFLTMFIYSLLSNENVEYHKTVINGFGDRKYKKSDFRIWNTRQELNESIEWDLNVLNPYKGLFEKYYIKNINIIDNKLITFTIHTDGIYLLIIELYNFYERNVTDTSYYEQINDFINVLGLYKEDINFMEIPNYILTLDKDIEVRLTINSIEFDLLHSIIVRFLPVYKHYIYPKLDFESQSLILSYYENIITDTQGFYPIINFASHPLNHHIYQFAIGCNYTTWLREENTYSFRNSEIKYWNYPLPHTAIKNNQFQYSLIDNLNTYLMICYNENINPMKNDYPYINVEPFYLNQIKRVVDLNNITIEKKTYNIRGIEMEGVMFSTNKHNIYVATRIFLNDAGKDNYNDYEFRISNLNLIIPSL